MHQMEVKMKKKACIKVQSENLSSFKIWCWDNESRKMNEPSDEKSYLNWLLDNLKIKWQRSRN